MVSWCDADSGEYYYWHTIYDEEHGSLLFESDGGKETALLGTDRVTCLPKKIVQDGEIKYWNNLNGGDV
jgi:hypothetical protein